MDILREWFEPGDELQQSLFCNDAQEQVSSLENCDGSSAATRTLPLLTTVTSAPPTEASVTGSLLRSHSLDEIYHLTTTQLQLSRELPCLPSARSEGNRCQSVFPNCSTADTSHVEIAMEMPRYLLQEDEALSDDTIAVEETYNSTIPYKVSMTTTGTSTHKVSMTTSDSSTVSYKASVPLSFGGEVLSEEKQHLTRTDSLPSSDSIVTTTSHHRQFSHSNKDVPVSEPGDTPALPPSLAVCIPFIAAPKTQHMLHTAKPVSLNATPINALHTTNNTTNNLCEKKKRRHGGGWPKGKSRKVEGHLSPPKPPPTGYAIFASEKRDFVQKQHGTSSMAVASKLLGQMWSQLTPQAKELYYSQAQKSRERYFSEIRTYFSQYYKGATADSLREMEKLMDANTAAENNNHVVSCSICQLSFTSLNNKRSHYGGRLHLLALIERLHHVVGSTDTPANQQNQTVHCEQAVSSHMSRDVSEQLGQVAMQHAATIKQLAEVKETYRRLLETNVKTQQELNELEYVESMKCEMVASLTTKGDETQLALDSLRNTLSDIVNCRTVCFSLASAGE